MAAQPPQPHITILPSPGLGHVTPLLELANHLVTHHSFKVSFLLYPSDSSTASDQLCRPATLPSDLHIIDLPPPDFSNIAVDDNDFVSHPPIPPVCTLIIDHPVTVLVVDMFFIDAIDVANELSIPTYLFFTSSTNLLAFSFYFPTLDQELNGDFSDLQMINIPGCKGMPVTDMFDILFDRRVLPMITRFAEVAGILVNTWEELEPITLHAMRENPFFVQRPPATATPPVYTVGPVIKMNEPVTETTHRCLTWLDKQPQNSVVYVSFGSGGTLSSEQIIELAWGLELSKQRFIWVVRRPIDSNASATYFGGDGENNPVEYLPEGFLGRTKEVGLVVPSWGPQVAVLSHLSTGGFLSHCGWNSVLESIPNGVPMIAWPLYAEQGMNSWFLVEDIGVAVRAVGAEQRSVMRREEVARVVRMVVEGEEGKVTRCRTIELQQSAKRALDCGGSSSLSLSQVAQSWKTQPKN
ncbi:unnamed protein product [Ilex paraguariensis]|uniref:Glycosyltransferase n=1 Tax=Ilex paraguariensis TaxID=185542 RepID=A0ABC8UA43_9AQUA